MAMTIELFTSTFDATKKAVKITETGKPERLLPVGQIYEIEDSTDGLTCKIYTGQGQLKVSELWTNITITGAATPALKKDKLVSFFAEAPAGGGGGGTGVSKYKSDEIDFYNGGAIQTLPLFTTETGRGRFIPSRVTLEMTDITGVPNGANFTTIYTYLCTGATYFTLQTTIVSYYTSNTEFDLIPAGTLVNVDINPNTLVDIVKGIFRIEGYYEDDYV